jgi:integrase
MASVSTDKTGLRRILFTWNGSRRTLYVGRLPAKSAQALATLVEAVIASKTAGVPFDADTAAKIKALGDDLHERLVAMELLIPRPKPLPLLPFVDNYIHSRTDWKPNSKRNAEQARRYLAGYFKTPVNLDAVTEFDAKAYKRYLEDRVGDNTARRNCKWASQFFRAAVDRRLIERNPFAVLRNLSMTMDDERSFFINRATALKVLDACPSTEWRLIFSLARFGGLRCPSEVTVLTWDDIDWAGRRFTVNSPKTGPRVVPLFPEVLSALDAQWEEAPDRTIKVIQGYHDNNNLRTQFSRILRRAGVKQWPKLFQNLRSTRETELTELYPLHVVCKWIGNSQPVALKHYLQVTEEHWRSATAIAIGHALPATMPSIESTEYTKIAGIPRNV